MSEKKNVIEKCVASFNLGQADTGSAVVQVAILSDRISSLTEHMSKNRQDRHSLRGLSRMVARRRKLLKYMQRVDVELYRKALNEFSLRG